MQQDNGIFFCLRHHFFYDLIRIFCFPVQRIDGPEHRKHPKTALQVFVPCPKRRSDIFGVIADNASDQLARFCNLFTCLFIRHFCNVHMGPGMVSDQMSIFCHLLYQFFISFDIFPDQKKGCLYASFSQTVQQLFRIDRMWSVVESQGNLRRNIR